MIARRPALSRSLPVVPLPWLWGRAFSWDWDWDSNYVAEMQVIFLCVCACAALAAAFPVSQMTDGQLEQALSSRSTIEQHLKCALDQAPCDPVGRRLKTLAPLVLRGACPPPQCSAQETWQIRRTLAFVQRNYPAEWAKIVRRFG